ncbi:MAG TPA: SRPBCC domain-containing protein [Puia sp.]|nr:SRPBCC domain-containing protein [Puia sp.]
MEKEMKVENTVRIDAPMGRVWAALTEPEWTKKYMFNCAVDSDWKVGSPVLWKMQHEGKEIIPVKGNVEEIIPGKFLRYSIIDPNMGIPDIPENYLHVTYALSGTKEGTELRVTQDGYEHAARGKERYEEAVKGGGWGSILAVIKELLEK